MSDDNGNGKLAAFAKEHGWRKWTAVNDEALRALVNDPDAEENRLWALALLRTWGNPNDPKDRAVDPNTGKRPRVADADSRFSCSSRSV